MGEEFGAPASSHHIRQRVVVLPVPGVLLASDDTLLGEWVKLASGVWLGIVVTAPRRHEGFSLLRALVSRESRSGGCAALFRCRLLA